MPRDIVEEVKNKFSDIEVFKKSNTRVYINVDKNICPNVIEYLFSELGGRLSTMTGIEVRSGIEILYHMAFDNLNLRITVKTLAESPKLEVESVTPFLPGAEWIEREIHELLGVNFVNHPKLEKLLTPDDWPDDNFPLRKEEEL